MGSQIVSLTCFSISKGGETRQLTQLQGWALFMF